jgi:glutamyl-tRNA synthetase
MSTIPVVTRFAPSPSGELHLGNARTALFSLLEARHDPAGHFLLRVEDTDAQRSHEHFVEALLADLGWLGLVWDQQPLRQSGRLALYAEQLARLEAMGKAYPCFCSSEELEGRRKRQIAAGLAPRYDGRCRALSPGERAARHAAGEPSTLRFAVPLQGEVSFTDLVHGLRVFACRDIGDFILRRVDGSPAFFFCNAYDDAATGVTRVLRGEDHLTNTPRQLLILEALGLRAPQYGHLSLLTGDDGAPLSKRHGATSVRELRERGFLASAILNHLFRLGHSTAQNTLLPLGQMAQLFTLSHLQRSPAHFQMSQLLHWQREAVRQMDVPAALAWLAPFLPVVLPDGQREAFVHAVLPNILLPGDASEWVEVVFGLPPQPDEEATAALGSAAPGLLAAAAVAAREHGNNFRALAEAARLASGARGAALFKPLRAALTGRLHGPELAPLLAAMSPGAAQERLERFT